jgi:S1-C subfamily serine protease
MKAATFFTHHDTGVLETMKYARSLSLVIVMTCILLNPIPARAGATDSVENSVVFLSQEAGKGKAVNFGTGFIVNRNNRPCLVTASHVARDLGRDFRMVMQGGDGKAVQEGLKGVVWNVSPYADAAFAWLPQGSGGDRGRVLARAIPEAFLTARTLPPSRDITLVAMGYPLGLGSKGYVSPLSFETKAASGLIPLERFDTRKDATFILLQSPSISGLSGGPVFDVGRPLIEGDKLEARNGISLVGLVSGVIWDKTGGKLAMIVPATEIARLFQSAPVRS